MSLRRGAVSAARTSAPQRPTDRARDRQLLLHTINGARSAYARIVFHKTFFERYTVTSTAPLMCKAIAKVARRRRRAACAVRTYVRTRAAHRCAGGQSAQHVFRSITSLEKSVEQCELQLLPDGTALTFVMLCHHGAHVPAGGRRRTVRGTAPPDRSLGRRHHQDVRSARAER